MLPCPCPRHVPWMLCWLLKVSRRDGTKCKLPLLLSVLCPPACLSLWALMTIQVPDLHQGLLRGCNISFCALVV